MMNSKALLLAMGLTVLTSGEPAQAGEFLAYIGTYTGANSKGIYVARFDPGTGKLSEPVLAAETRNPSFLAVPGNRKFLYAVGEFSGFNGKPVGAVSAFRIEPGSGKLTLINQEASGGSGPTHLDLDKTGRCVLAANYGSGSVAALPVREDGSLGPVSGFVQHQGSSVNPKRQAGPHAHFVTTDPGNRRAFVCDLGLDQVLAYNLDARDATLDAHPAITLKLHPGAGPRHLVFRPDGKFLYVINELSSDITAYRFDGRNAALEELQTVSTVPHTFKGENTCAEIQVHPSGKFVYGSNRGHDSVAVFSVEKKTGRLTPVEHEPTQGKSPRFIGLDPTGKWLVAANQQSDNVVVFKVDRKTGSLAPTGQSLHVGTPVCVLFVPGAK